MALPFRSAWFDLYGVARGAGAVVEIQRIFLVVVSSQFHHPSATAPGVAISGAHFGLCRPSLDLFRVDLAYWIGRFPLGRGIKTQGLAEFVRFVLRVRNGNSSFKQANEIAFAIRAAPEVSAPDTCGGGRNADVDLALLATF